LFFVVHRHAAMPLPLSDGLPGGLEKLMQSFADVLPEMVGQWFVAFNGRAGQLLAFILVFVVLFVFRGFLKRRTVYLGRLGWNLSAGTGGKIPWPNLFESVSRFIRSLYLPARVRGLFRQRLFPSLVFAFVVLYFLYRLNQEPQMIFDVGFMFLVLLLINVTLYSFDNDPYNNLKIAMYVNTMGIFLIATTLVIIFQTPSIFTALFLAYAITAIYQDYKVMFISNIALFTLGILLVVQFDTIFTIPGNDSTQNVFIIIFLILFVLLLTLSSYILIKRKTFFYNHLAQIKESEVRNINLYVDINHLRTETSLDYEKYYKVLEQFSAELSKKIGIENVFSRKIRLLMDLKK